MPLTSIDIPFVSETISDIELVGRWSAYRNPTGRRVMEPATRAKPRRGGFVAVALPCSLMLVAAAARPAIAAGCSFEPQGEGRVAAVIDARSFRLEDGREVLLAGIELAEGEQKKNISALSAIVAGRELKLSGPDDTPDRYGRQPAFGFLDPS